MCNFFTTIEGVEGLSGTGALPCGTTNWKDMVENEPQQGDDGSLVESATLGR